MSQSSSSTDKKDRNRSRSQEKQYSKLLVTNLNAKSNTKQIEDQLRRLFEKYGSVETIFARRSKNSQYCIAFIQMNDRAAAEECVKNYDKSHLNGKEIKVQLQHDNCKRKKDQNKKCNNCGKLGHFARQCSSSRKNECLKHAYLRRSHSRSRSGSSNQHKKNNEKQRSHSSERNYFPKSKRQRRNRSKDKEEKRKKHKRSFSSNSCN